jgi:hypothetical protein
VSLGRRWATKRRAWPIHDVGEPVVTGLTPHDNAALARALGDRRDSCQTAQGGVVTLVQGIEGFCQQRGEDDPSHHRQVCEDLHVMLLLPPRVRLLGRNEAGGQRREPLMGVLMLTVDETDARNERGEVCAGGFDRAGGNLDGRPAQHIEHMGGIKAADAIALGNFGDRYLAATRSLVGCWHGFPQIELLRSAIVFKLEYRWKVASDLLAHAVGQPIALGAEVFGDARPLAQLGDRWIGNREQPGASGCDYLNWSLHSVKLFACDHRPARRFRAWHRLYRLSQQVGLTLIDVRNRLISNPTRLLPPFGVVRSTSAPRPPRERLTSILCSSVPASTSLSQTKSRIERVRHPQVGCFSVAKSSACSVRLLHHRDLQE